MKNIEAFIDDGGEITIGPVGSIQCAATASDADQPLAMLVRREGETLNALLRRLDKAIAHFYADNEITDEINGPRRPAVKVERPDAHLQDSYI